MDNIKLDPFDFYRSQNFYPHRMLWIFIVLISIGFVTDVSSRRTIDRSVILKNQRDEVFKYLIPCTARFIEEYFEYPDRISLLIPDTLQDTSRVIESLMNELHVTSAIYTLNVNLINAMEAYDALTNVVILSKSGIALEVNDSSIVNFCEHCNFIIVLTNLFTDEESFLMEAAMLIQQMSLQSIFKLEILASVGDSVLLASSLPLRINESYALAEPAFSGRCEQQATATRWQYFTNKTKSLLDDGISVAIFDKFPFAFLINDTNYLRFGGIEGSMVEEIARNMKIKLNRRTIESTHNTTLKTEIYLRFYNETDDLVFGGLLWDFNRKMTYTTCYGMVHISWIIPTEVNVSLRGLIAPFDVNIWYAIICVMIIGGLVKLFVIRDITFLDIAALVLGVPASQPTKTSSRIQFISWSLYGFFLTQLYLGSLADFLISTTDMQMESMEELVNSGLKIGGIQRFADLLKTPDKTDLEDNVRRVIREKFIILKRNDYYKQLLDLVEGRNTSMALPIMLNLTKNYPSEVGHAHIIKETVGSYPLAFVTRQDFPYLADFNFKIQVLVQTGLVEFWSNMAVNESHRRIENEGDDNSKVIDLDDIAPAFLLLIIGYLGGCCLLIIEVIFYPSKLFL